jgi:hypothetical protein
LRIQGTGIKPNPSWTWCWWWWWECVFLVMNVSRELVAWIFGAE